eukprot:9206381-Pyramimonas_sp.AAC.1
MPPPPLLHLSRRHGGPGGDPEVGRFWLGGLSWAPWGPSVCGAPWKSASKNLPGPLSRSPKLLAKLPERLASSEPSLALLAHYLLDGRGAP